MIFTVAAGNGAQSKQFVILVFIFYLLHISISMYKCFQPNFCMHIKCIYTINCHIDISGGKSIIMPVVSMSISLIICQKIINWINFKLYKCCIHVGLFIFVWRRCFIYTWQHWNNSRISVWIFCVKVEIYKAHMHNLWSNNIDKRETLFFYYRIKCRKSLKRAIKLYQDRFYIYRAAIFRICRLDNLYFYK